MTFRLAVVASHPIQYQSPLWRRLTERGLVRPTVLFLSRHGLAPSYDPGFGREVRLDDDLLSGFASHFVANVAPRPDVSSPTGLVNPGLATAIRADRYDAVLVHGHWPPAIWLAYATARARRLPYLIRGESHAPAGQATSLRAVARERLLRVVVRGAGACLAIGEHNARFYAHYGASAARVLRSPYCVDNRRFAELGARGRARRAPTLEALGLDPRLPTVMFAAKMIDRKRPLDLVAAHTRMRRPSNLLLVGDGVLLPRVERAVRDEPHSRTLGFLDQAALAETLGVADVFVLPSDYETWGLAVNEAMAAGAVPVVSEVVGCAPDLVPPHIGGTFPVGDIDGLARTLDEIVEDRDELERRRARAQSWVERNSLDAAAEGIEQGTSLACAGGRRCGGG